jgi:MYXO-CTERM domain-containing protein
MVEVFVEADLAVGEGMAETFIPPAHFYPFTIKKVQFIASNRFMAGKCGVTFKIYQDGGTVPPGRELASFKEAEIEGTPMAWQEVDTPPTLVQNGAVRVAFFPDLQTINMDSGLTLMSDRKAPPGTHTLACANLPGPPCTWKYGKDLGVKGTWALRLVVDIPTAGNRRDLSGGGGDEDGGATGDAPVVDSITPAMGTGAVSAIILGRNFVAAAPGSTVLFDTRRISDALVMDDRTIKITTPVDLPAGIYDVVVQNPNGAIGRLPNAFTVGGMAGCNCAVGGPSAPPVGLALLLVAAALLLRRR